MIVKYGKDFWLNAAIDYIFSIQHVVDFNRILVWVF